MFYVINNGKIFKRPQILSGMTSLEAHKKNIQQFLKDIEEKIRANLLLERQKIIGFAASEAATNLLEYFLHKKNLIPAGFKVNHNYFASEKRAAHYLDFDFSHKKELISFLVRQDAYRNLLCYGREKSLDAVKEAIANLQKVKKLVEKELGEEL